MNVDNTGMFAGEQPVPISVSNPGKGVQKKDRFFAVTKVESPLQQDGRIRVCATAHGSGCRAWRRPKAARFKVQEGLAAGVDQ